MEWKYFVSQTYQECEKYNKLAKKPMNTSNHISFTFILIKKRKSNAFNEGNTYGHSLNNTYLGSPGACTIIWSFNKESNYRNSIFCGQHIAVSSAHFAEWSIQQAVSQYDDGSSTSLNFSILNSDNSMPYFQGH